jgi:hypothetical protein
MSRITDVHTMRAEFQLRCIAQSIFCVSHNKLQVLNASITSKAAHTPLDVIDSSALLRNELLNYSHLTHHSMQMLLPIA